MEFSNENKNIAWCPGCGNYGILNALKQALEMTGYTNRETVIVSGIGQAAKAPQYINANGFSGLHGRALPAATGIKLSNKDLKVIVTSGDGDIYGEGGNHFLHAIRRNPDITVIVFNNMIYGLTKGQASPTSQPNFTGKMQTHKNENEPFNPIAVAIAQNISFAARAFTQDMEKTRDIMLEAINHKGFALVDVLTQCVSFNKVNTYQWFRDNTYYVENHDPYDRSRAIALEFESEKFPLGVIFKQDKPVLEESEMYVNQTPVPLYRHEVDFEGINVYLFP
jgi:2-oxoglutarate ferredoxin oxidoreductase subunit beta